MGLKKNNQNYIYHNNLHGDIVTVTQYNKAIGAQYSYDPWGTQKSYTGTLVQPFRYAGYYYDTETGLYYLKCRYYNPTLGRFLTKDSYGYITKSDPQTLNLYTYCGNNPVNFTDPDGHSILGITIGAIISAVVTTAIATASSGSGSSSGSSSSSSNVSNIISIGCKYLMSIINNSTFGAEIAEQPLNI